MSLYLSRKNLPVKQNGNVFAIPRTIKYLGIVAVAVSMTSCSRDIVDEPQVKLTKSEIFVNNNSAELSKRVTMYGKTAPLTRTGNGADITMPAAPEVPQNKMVMDDSYHGWNAGEGDYYLPAGNTLKTDLQFKDNVYYIGGELTITNYWNSGQGKGKLVVLPGGKVHYPSSKLAVDRIDILNYGEFDMDADVFTVNRGATFMTVNDFSAPKLNIGGTFYVGDAMTATSVNVSDNGILHIGCGLVVENYMKINNSATVYIGSYLSSPSVEMNSSSLFTLKSGSLVSTNRLMMKNPCIVTVDGGNMEYSVISTDTLEINQSNVKDMFTGWLDIHYKTLDNRSGSDDSNIEWLSSVKLNGDTYLPAEGCHPAFGPDTKPDNKPAIGLEHIAQVESPDHTHDISSTCIQTVGDKAYVSYHTRGGGYHGCVEVLRLSAGKCSILSYMEAPALDFNHLIVDNDRIIVAGDAKSGAFLGIVNLENGMFKTGATELTQVKLEGASTNCVIRNGAYLHTTTNAGYQTLDANTFESIASVTSAGSSKFIHANGANMGVLSLTDKNSMQSKAALGVYGASDYGFSSPVKTVSLDMITPVTGKNVFQLDGDDVYVCLGANGVKRYSNGVEVAAFKLSDDSAAAANGLAVDDKYVYVAYGHGGLFVLNKSDLKVMASYRYAGGKSANYVTVSGNILYVAYGLSGVQIFKLVEKK